MSLLMLFLVFGLGAWSVYWIGLSLQRLKGLKTDEKYVWLSHIAWCYVNLAIVAIGIFTVANANITTDFVTTQRNIVAFNILLDVLYVTAALLMIKSLNAKVAGFGAAMKVQGAFLFVFDIVFAAAITLFLL